MGQNKNFQAKFKKICSISTTTENIIIKFESIFATGFYIFLCKETADVHGVQFVLQDTPQKNAHNSLFWEHLLRKFSAPTPSLADVGLSCCKCSNAKLAVKRYTLCIIAWSSNSTQYI